MTLRQQSCFSCFGWAAELRSQPNRSFQSPTQFLFVNEPISLPDTKGHCDLDDKNGRSMQNEAKILHYLYYKWHDKFWESNTVGMDM